jgi:phage FluMu protein Com
MNGSSDGGRRGAPAKTAASRTGAGDVRCLCGALVARIVGDHLELKCRRCMRVGIVRLASAEAEGGVLVRWS